MFPILFWLYLDVGPLPETSGFAGVGLGLRQDGGSEAATGFIWESSGLEMPTGRNTFPMTRTTGRIFILGTVEATLFLMDELKP
jgi:hypothetical protein